MCLDLIIFNSNDHTISFTGVTLFIVVHSLYTYYGILLLLLGYVVLILKTCISKLILFLLNLSVIQNLKNSNAFFVIIP